MQKPQTNPSFHDIYLWKNSFFELKIRPISVLVMKYDDLKFYLFYMLKYENHFKKCTCLVDAWNYCLLIILVLFGLSRRFYWTIVRGTNFTNSLPYHIGPIQIELEHLWNNSWNHRRFLWFLIRYVKFSFVNHDIITFWRFITWFFFVLGTSNMAHLRCAKCLFSAGHYVRSDLVFCGISQWKRWYNNGLQNRQWKKCQRYVRGIAPENWRAPRRMFNYVW